MHWCFRLSWIALYTLVVMLFAWVLVFILQLLEVLTRFNYFLLFLLFFLFGMSNIHFVLMISPFFSEPAVGYCAYNITVLM